ncbi:hypothetical protein TWF730_001846 [Orbilia blumenaviensis]|uniref:Uncharacterized protein n=1 Tax=Orbilia blumenaviensis TaxID=1796055 RepID=A0AAV9UC80_9PEZI
MPPLDLIPYSGGLGGVASQIAPRLLRPSGISVFPNWMFDDLTYLTTATPTEKKIPPSAESLNWEGPYCQLGLWADSLGKSPKGGWAGWPLGAPDLNPFTGNAIAYWDHIRDNRNSLSNQCVNLMDLNTDLPGMLSSYRTTGYCECEFFAEENCVQESTRFAAYNREDREMWKNGKANDDAIKSIKCRYAESWHGTNGFTVSFIDNKSARRLEQEDEMGPMKKGISLAGTWSSGVIRADDSKKCIKVGHPDAADGNFLVTDITVVHATCHFYLDPNCNEDIYYGVLRDDPYLTIASDGKAEWVDPDSGDRRGKTIRSFKCFAPYNISWDSSNGELLQAIRAKLMPPPS